MTKNLLTRAQAAEYCGVSVRTIDRLRKECALKYYQYKDNGKVLIPQSEIDQHFKANIHYHNH